MSRKDQPIDIGEESPLIAAQHTGEDSDVDDGDVSVSDSFGMEDSIVESKSTLYLILLTISIGGLQVFWSLEFSNGSPYLLSLGMSKALLAFVWLAGPLTGSLVQPYVGIVSDRSRIKWGKRRPFIVGGAIGIITTSILLSYIKDVVWVLGPWATDATYEGWWMWLTITFATILMWILDFSINTAQAAIRAFIVDNAPAHQQDDANAWASRMTGIGNVFGYIFGYLNLAKHFYFLGNTQFKVLCVIASFALGSTVLISILTINERNPQDDAPSKADYENDSGIIAFFKQVFTAIRKLSPAIRSVCIIQLWNWIGWFPFLFYTTTYIGQLYVDPYLHPGLTKEEIDALWTRATRYATLALLVCAIVTLAVNIVLPFIIVPTYKPPSSDDTVENFRPISPTSPIGTRDRNVSFRSLNSSHSRRYQVKPRPSFFTRFLERLRIPGLTLRRAWLYSQILHAVCMFSTFFIRTPLMATIMTAVVGIPWSLTLWAPFALISGDIAKRTELRRKNKRQKLINGSEGMSSSGMTNSSRDDDEQGDRTGIILGLHNVAVSSPQVVATLISSLIFKFLEKDRGTPGDVSVQWIMRMGGVSLLAAAFCTWRMREPAADIEEST